MRLTVFSDGSGTTGGPAGIAYVAYATDDLAGVKVKPGRGPHREGSLPLANATNQQAEILAATLALHELPEGSDISVVSDSEYLVKGWNEYLPRWRELGWRKPSGGTPKNLAHWRRLIVAAERHRTVVFVWTRGHAGTEGNERADRLAGAARAAAREMSATPIEGGVT